MKERVKIFMHRYGSLMDKVILALFLFSFIGLIVFTINYMNHRLPDYSAVNEVQSNNQQIATVPLNRGGGVIEDSKPTFLEEKRKKNISNQVNDVVKKEVSDQRRTQKNDNQPNRVVQEIVSHLADSSNYVKEKADNKNKKSGEAQDNRQITKLKNSTVLDSDLKVSDLSKFEELHMVQLGAFGSVSTANKLRKKVLAKYPNDLRGINYVIDQRYNLRTKKNSTFYRLRLGPFSSSENANKFCNKYKKVKGYDCFYVKSVRDDD